MKKRLSPYIIIPLLLLIIWLIGDLMFMDILGVGRLMAKRKLPEVAKSMGFKEKPGSSPRSFNEYSGKYKGHFVKVEPESATITVYMRHIPNLDLSTTYKKTKFDTGNPKFDRFFTERMAPKDVGEKISRSDELIEFVGVFGKKWKRKCKFVAVSYDNVRCAMKYGNGHYIPADVLEPIISDLIQMADLLNAAVNTKFKKTQQK